MSLQATTSQTVGPYFTIGLDPLNRTQIASPEIAGERITIRGQILDGDGQPVPDALLETWQADAEGRYHHPEGMENLNGKKEFFGFGRIPTDDSGCFRFTTIKPGPVPGPEGTTQAPHIVVSIFMRGLLTRRITRVYFFGDLRNENDYVLNLIESARRDTLMARPETGDGNVLVWNVRLQGESETVFFDC
jgi:protocatechuate 3,4-dioxygenase, alpha subunit